MEIFKDSMNPYERIAELEYKLKDSDSRCKSRDKVIAKLEEENLRLRRALIEIREARGIFEPNGLRRIAREALNRRGE